MSETPCNRLHQKKPTVRDVAKLAETSTATISRYFNQPDAVRPRLKQRIEAAISELNYVPHSAARALNTNQSRTIGAIVPTLSHALFAQALQGLQQSLAQAGYTLITASSMFDLQTEQAALRAMLSKGVDGVMLVGATHTEQCYQLLTRYQVPYVNTWVYTPEESHPSIGFDNIKISAQVADYIQDLGHEKIAMISGFSRDNDRTQDRISGVRHALIARGNTLPDRFLIECDFSIRAGRDAFIRLIELAEPPTAIICGSDLFAVGALQQAQRMGIKVPGELSITGFDDMEIASQLLPALTTVRVPSLEMGTAAAAHLLAQIEGGQPVHQQLEPELILRETTAKLD